MLNLCGKLLNIGLLRYVIQKGVIMLGKVKSFNKEKGYGFITGEDGKDVFFHYSALQMGSFKTIEVGASVEFEAQDSERGLRASKVVKL